MKGGIGKLMKQAQEMQKKMLIWHPLISVWPQDNPGNQLQNQVKQVTMYHD